MRYISVEVAIAVMLALVLLVGIAEPFMPKTFGPYASTQDGPSTGAWAGQ